MKAATLGALLPTCPAPQMKQNILESLRNEVQGERKHKFPAQEDVRIHKNPFADAIRGDEQGVQDGLIHVRIQQRNGRKTLTTVQGISDDYDKKKIVRACKKEFACNGTVVEHPEYGEVMQLQGDQRNNICQFLTRIGIAKPEQLKVHGF
ncbi:hypothetical protein HPB48_007437 [Haemaphysalis longicornis]|uniref:Eukaryotic translation initiation factor eIF1 n=1 Tax=Haemaphysalis longicornis TaxID=44386 RepID=A0A9J6G3Y2_HAELO|nr:hypothetical protein HPB48_007437 [Haemaphysalis longicornis]